MNRGMRQNLLKAFITRVTNTARWEAGAFRVEWRRGPVYAGQGSTPNTAGDGCISNTDILLGRLRCGYMEPGVIG